MYFMNDDPLRDIERMMQSIPNFQPRGHGIMSLCKYEYTAEDCDCSCCPYHTGRGKNAGCLLERCACVGERIAAGAASLAEAVAEATAAIRLPAFEKRLRKYLKESEDTPMYFKNEAHRAVFAEAVRRLDRKNLALMAAVYLLTAERRLWSCAEQYTERNRVRFGDIRLRGTTENGYTLHCAAKDLYLGTKNLTIGDLADTELIPPKTFGLICNAMAIRRFGLGTVKFKEGGTYHA